MQQKNDNLKCMTALTLQANKQPIVYDGKDAQQKIKREQKQCIDKLNRLCFFPILAKRIGKIKKTESYSCYVASDNSQVRNCLPTQTKKRITHQRVSQIKIKRIGRVNPSKAFNLIVLSQLKNEQKFQSILPIHQTLQSASIYPLNQSQDRNGNQISQKNIKKELNKLKYICKRQKSNDKEKKTHKKIMVEDMRRINKVDQIQKKSKSQQKFQQRLQKYSPRVMVDKQKSAQYENNKQQNEDSHQSDSKNQQQTEYRIVINTVSHHSIDHKNNQNQLHRKVDIQENRATTPKNPLKKQNHGINGQKPIIHQMKFKKSASKIPKHNSQYLNIYKSNKLNSSKRTKSKQKISFLSSSLATPDINNLGTDKVDSSRTFNSCGSKQHITKSLSKSIIIQQKPHILFKSHPFLDGQKRTNKPKNRKNGKQKNNLQRFSVNHPCHKNNQQFKQNIIQKKNNKQIRKKNSRELKMHYCLQQAKQHLQKQKMQQPEY